MKILINNNKKINFTKIGFIDGKFIKFFEQNNNFQLLFPKSENNFELREKIGFVRNLIREAKKFEIENLEIDFLNLVNILNLKKEKMLETKELTLEFIVIQFLMANYEFDKFKTENKNKVVKNILFTNILDKNFLKKDFDHILKKAFIIGEQINKCREVANSPANIINPVSLAEYVKKEVIKLENGNVSFEILDEKGLQKIKAGGILAVGSGSKHQSQLIILKYFPNKNQKNDLCFIGKGITHDNGGINLKPSSGGSLEEMHLDMSGASAVLHSFLALVKLKVKKNIISIIPAAENSISGSSYRPGDIITMLSGKTVEVLNTDAEGRIVLADALTYAKKYNPELIIDVATLTGAAIVALGYGASAVLSHKKNLSLEISEIGNGVGDFMWPLPMWNIYKKSVKNKRADIGNIPESNSKVGGAINGAIFLKEFINDEQNWIHIDMAPRMIATDGDNLANGATGELVRTLIKLGRK
jgi:leucyl aminopeptidase